MVVSSVVAIGGAAGRPKRCPTPLHRIDHLGIAMHVEKGVVKPGKGGVGEVLGSS